MRCVKFGAMVSSRRSIYRLLLWILLFFFCEIAAQAASFSAHIQDNVQVVTVAGAIQYGDANNLDFFASTRLRLDIPTIFQFRSFGGDLAEAFRMQGVLRETASRIESQEKPVWAYIDAICSSACISLYLVFNRRAMSKLGQLGFHSPHIHDVPSAFDRDTYLKNFIRAGIARNWIEAHIGIFLTAEITSYSAYRLVQEKSNFLSSEADILSLDELIKQRILGNISPLNAENKVCTVKINGKHFYAHKTRNFDQRVNPEDYVRIGNGAIMEIIGDDTVTSRGKNYPGKQYRVLRNVINGDAANFAIPGDIIWILDGIYDCTI